MPFFIFAEVLNFMYFNEISQIIFLKFFSKITIFFFAKIFVSTLPEPSVHLSNELDVRESSQVTSVRSSESRDHDTVMSLRCEVRLFFKLSLFWKFYTNLSCYVRT